jgi:hypothetical protein
VSVEAGGEVVGRGGFVFLGLGGVVVPSETWRRGGRAGARVVTATTTTVTVSGEGTGIFIFILDLDFDLDLIFDLVLDLAGAFTVIETARRRNCTILGVVTHVGM